MIDVKEVRLGNLILWNPKLANPQITLQPMLVEIAVIAQDKIGYTPYKLEQRVEPFEDDRMVQMETIVKSVQEFEPLQVTEEILEKTGFQKRNGAYVLDGFYPEVIFKESQGSAVLVPHSKVIPIRYIHQLQNLYYTIMGEDLVIIL